MKHEGSKKGSRPPRAALAQGAALLLLAGAGAVQAQPATLTPEPPPPSPAPPAAVPEADAAAPPDTVFTVGEIVARGTRRRQLSSRDLPGSVDVVGADQIRNESVDEPLELLRRVPGVAVEDFNQGIISSDVSVRGFNPQGEVAPIKLLVDGVPSNLHNGLADLKPIFPLEMERIELVRGTHDPRYGLYAVAGNLQVFTRTGGNYSVLRGTAGSFNTYEAQAASGFESGGFSQNLFGGFRYSEGFRENAELQRYALSGKWFYRFGTRVRAGVSGRMFRMDADAPGYLTEMQADSAPQSSPAFSQTDGGLQSNRQGSAHLEADLTNQLFLSLRGYHQTFKRQRFVRFTEAARQQERYDWEKHSGGLGQLTFRLGRLGPLHDLTLSVGGDFEHQDNVHRRFVTDGARNRVTANRDQQFDLSSYGAFAAADVQPWRWLRLVGGLRWDRLDGGMKNLLRGGPEAELLEFGNIWQPKVSAMITPIDGYSVYGNYGRTFQTPLREGLYGAQPGVSYSKNDGWEAGAKLSPGRWASGRVAYWRQTASDEVRLKFNSPTDVENVGETLRHGLDVEASVSPVAPVAVWATYTYQRAEIVNPGANTPALAGASLSHVPSYLLKAGVDARPIEALVASAWVYSQGKYGITDASNLMVVPPSARFAGFTLVNVDLSYSWQRLTFGGHVRNLLGTRWDSTVWNDGAVTLYNPGDARAFLASVETTF